MHPRQSFFTKLYILSYFTLQISGFFTLNTRPNQHFFHETQVCPVMSLPCDEEACHPSLKMRAILGKGIPKLSNLLLDHNVKV
jgi:hypothetical protein